VIRLLLAPLVFKFALLDENGHVEVVRLLLPLNSDENIVETLTEAFTKPSECEILAKTRSIYN
jgi:hypothetical protein